MDSNKISIFKTKKDLYFNFENKNDNFILITGLSGSGKSTLARNLASKLNGDKISLDLVFGHETEKTELEEKIIAKFQKQYPEWNPSIFTKNNKEIYPYYINLFYDFIITNLKNHKTPIIIEGYFFINYIKIDKIKDKKIIIKRNSLIKSMTNRIKRNIFIFKKQILDNKNIKFRVLKYLKRELRDLIFTTLKSIIWYKEINNYIEKILKSKTISKIEEVSIYI